MTRRIAGAVMALAAMVALPAPAAAQDGTWTVSPGGDFFGQSISPPIFGVQESGVDVFCSSGAVTGTTQTGAGLTNPLAVFPELPGIDLLDCQSPFRPYDIDQVGDWYLHGDSYDGLGVTSGRITDVELAVSGVGCTATITGHLDVTYSNGLARLTVLPTPTLVFSHVDPVDDCLGLFQQGEHVSLDVAFDVSPNPTISSP